MSFSQFEVYWGFFWALEGLFRVFRSTARQQTARSACIWMQQKLSLPSTSRSACIWMQQRRYTSFFREDFRIRSKLCVSGNHTDIQIDMS
ncbi:hypothetical protein Hanom_Chr06g00542251 [Helianthus anomalus]